MRAIVKSIHLRSWLVIPLLTTVCPSVAADFPIEAKTADGKTVDLYEDGTWRPKSLQLGHIVIRKSDFATQPFKSKLGFYEEWIDQRLWKESQADGDFEYVFEHARGEAWCGIIPERVQLTQDALAKAMLTNLQQADPNAKLQQRSKAYVNSLPGELIEISGTVEGVVASYYAFAWSGNKGTVQITCWTSTNLMDEYRPVFNDFIGGFTLAE